MAVDYVVKVPKSDIKAYSNEYPYQAVQVHSPRHYPEHPFRIDPQFRRAFSKAIRKFGGDELIDSEMVKPSKRLLKLIYDNF